MISLFRLDLQLACKTVMMFFKQYVHVFGPRVTTKQRKPNWKWLVISWQRAQLGTYPYNAQAQDFLWLIRESNSYAFQLQELSIRNSFKAVNCEYIQYFSLQQPEDFNNNFSQLLHVLNYMLECLAAPILPLKVKKMLFWHYWFLSSTIVYKDSMCHYNLQNTSTIIFPT